QDVRDRALVRTGPESPARGRPMEKATRVLAFVLAGGEGRRLAPLTTHVAKPAAPFHARHRLVDFALSNLRNSGITDIEVLLQYQPQSLLQHLRRAWDADRPGAD